MSILCLVGAIAAQVGNPQEWFFNILFIILLHKNARAISACAFKNQPNKKYFYLFIALFFALPWGLGGQCYDGI